MGDVTFASKSSIVTGTTTATNTAVVSIDTRGLGPTGKLVASIKNLSATSTMYYQINGYFADPTGGNNAGQYAAVKVQTSIASSTAIVSTDVSQPYACVQILVQNNSGACAFQIDYVTI